MKKFITMVFSLLIVISLLSGCGESDRSSEIINIDMSSLRATDMNGNEVTADIFQNYDITMVNVWDTTCQHCVEEMPALEKLYEGLPDNVNLISICVDADNDPQTAARELTDTGVEFTTLVGNEQLDELLTDIIGHPTTFFVDSTGKSVGSVISGVPADGEDEIIDAYTEQINDALKIVDK